jgi:hypothetical protein
MFTNIKQYYFTFLLFFCGNAQSRPQVCKTRERLCVVFVVSAYSAYSAYSVYSAVENRRIPAAHTALRRRTVPQHGRLRGRQRAARPASEVNQM